MPVVSRIPQLSPHHGLWVTEMERRTRPEKIFAAVMAAAANTKLDGRLGAGIVKGDTLIISPRRGEVNEES